MLENIKSKLQSEQVQRTVLTVGGMVVTFVATQTFAILVSKGIETGIDALMTKWHPTTEVAE